MAAFDFTDYKLWPEEKWVNYDAEHKDIRDKCKAIAPHFGLVYNTKNDYYFMTLSRNPANLEMNWKTEIESLELVYMGEAFCGALLVYFRIRHDNETIKDNKEVQYG